MALSTVERMADAAGGDGGRATERPEPREPDAAPDQPAAQGDGVSPVGSEFFMHSAMLLLGRLVTETVGFYNRRFALDKRDVTRIYANVARAARYKGHRDKAVAAYQEIVKLAPRDPEAQLQLGRLYLEQGQHERATNAFRAVVRLRPTNAEAHFRLGLCLLRQQNLESALQSLEKAVELDPGNARAYHRIALIRDKQGRTDDAIAALQKAVELDPGQVRLHQQLGFLYESAGRHDEAVGCFKKVLELESESEEDL